MKQGAANNFAFIEPMNALRVRDLPAGNWLYELKFDGYRALAFKADKEVRLVSRDRKSFNNDYPQFIDSLKLLTTENVIIDGEITALDQNGRSSFQLLQSYAKTKQTPLVYHAFDLLFLDGIDLALDRLLNDASYWPRCSKKLHPISASPKNYVARKKSFSKLRRSSNSKGWLQSGAILSKGRAGAAAPGSKSN